MLCTVRTLEGPCSRRAAYRVLNLRNKWVGRVCLAHASRSELEGVMGGCRLRSLYCSTCGAVLSDEEGDRCHACFQFFNQESTVALRTPEQDRPLATLSLDAEAAAWRLAGSQFVKLARDPIVALLSRHLAPGDESLRARIAAFLGTELGASLLAAMLSAGLSSATFLPGANHEVTERLGRELRVRALAGTGDVLADVVMGPLREVMAGALSGTLSGVPQVAHLPEGGAGVVVSPVVERVEAAR